MCSEYLDQPKRTYYQVVSERARNRALRPSPTDHAADVEVMRKWSNWRFLSKPSRVWMIEGILTGNEYDPQYGETLWIQGGNV